MNEHVSAAVLVAGIACCLLAGDAVGADLASYAPVTSTEAAAVLARVRDTESSLGPLGASPQDVTLGDLVRFHGHPCDGLVAAAEGIALGLRQLFPDGVVDRTDLAAATNASPCYSDAAAYLTGARTLYGTLVIDRSLGDEWVLLRRSKGQAVRVRLRAGVKPAELPGLEAQLRAAGCDAALIGRVQAIQTTYVRRILGSPREASYQVDALVSFPYPVGGSRPDAAKAACPRAASPEGATP